LSGERFGRPRRSKHQVFLQVGVWSAMQAWNRLLSIIHQRLDDFLSAAKY
jgi:hypothetical protein